MKKNHSFTKFWAPILILTSLIACRTPEKPEQGAELEVFTTYLDQRIPALMRTYDIPGVVVAVVRNGRPAWSGAYGYADVAAGRKMTTDTWCRVESISKSVTAWGVMKLVEDGQIELDQPVVRYLKNWEFPPSSFPGEEITIRQLLSHTSGLALGTIGVRYDPRGEVPSLEEQLDKDAVLMWAPGQGFSYSNAGFNVLELLIESVSGRDFADYMRAEVLTPLGMEHASFTWSEDFDPPVPNGYDLNGVPIPVYVYPDKAAGGLFARVEDITNFVSAGMTRFNDTGRRALDPKTIGQLYSPVVERPGVYHLAFDAYGLGHFIEWLPTGRKAVSHGGQGSGWMTHFHAVPETGDGIIILTNSQRSWPFFAYLLNDWATWRGFGAVGMGKIIVGTRILWVVIGLLSGLTVWLVWRLIRGLIAGDRRLAPLVLFLIFILWWTANQDYLFIASVFPVTYGWLWVATAFLAGALLLLVLLPSLRKSKRRYV